MIVDHGHLLQGSGGHCEPTGRHSVKEQGTQHAVLSLLATKRLLECTGKSNSDFRITQSMTHLDVFETSGHSVGKHLRRLLRNENIVSRSQIHWLQLLRIVSMLNFG